MAQREVAGTALIEQSLQRLNVLGSVLMIAAHPDDENTAVLAYFARGRHMRTGYLSATRGEGGQNLIGSEQGDLLGLIRTQELLAARRIDGAEQFFTRAVDFGFSKQASETLEKWGREQVLSDMVWVIRRFRPDVILMTFSGTPRDGHGQHQASAILGREAFAAAGDPTRFPEQLRWVKPWQPKRAMQSLYVFNREMQRAADEAKNRLEIDPGTYNPVLGYSYNEIAGMSRSMHRSQAMGFAERRGQAPTYMVPVAGDSAAKDIFDGIDTTWTRLAGGAAVGELLTEAHRGFDPEHPEKTVPLLARVRPLMAAMDDPLARAKLADLDEAIALCAGLWVDAQAERPQVAPGAELAIAVNLLRRSQVEMRVERAQLAGMWTDDVPAPSAPLPFNQVQRIDLHRTVPTGQPYSQPYWLAAPRHGDRYTVTDQALIGLADTPAVAQVRLAVALAGVTIELQRPVQHRYVDRAQGERLRPLAIVPPVAVSLAEDVALFPTAAARRVAVAVSATTGKASGTVRLDAPTGWKVDPASRSFDVAEPGEQQELSFDVTPPAGETTASLRAVANLGGREVSSGLHSISYPHVPIQTLFPPAAAKLVRTDIRVTARRVGYVMGAGDQMPESLRQLGCQVTLLAPSDLQQRRLEEFDAIVAGVRAYNVRPDLHGNHARLMDYVRNGGTYIVQYNTADGNLPPLGPYPFTVARDRVAVEDAPVTFTDPASPLLKTPNTITAADFAGWIQERGLYFAGQWDPRYQTVVESHDPGEKPLPGGTLYARVGKGVYIFTAYSWFRELPAGVPGAYRIFANLLSAK